MNVSFQRRSSSLPTCRLLEFVVFFLSVIRIIAFKSPPSLPSLPPPPHPIPPLFSLYNTSFPAPTPPSTPNTAPYRPTTPNSNSSSRRTPSGGKVGSKGGRRGGLDFDGGESVGLGVGPGGVEVEEAGTLRGLRDATGGSGVMETRWGTGSELDDPNGFSAQERFRLTFACSIRYGQQDLRFESEGIRLCVGCESAWKDP